MGLLTFSLNVTLDGCVDHQEGIADDETHAGPWRRAGAAGLARVGGQVGRQAEVRGVLHAP